MVEKVLGRKKEPEPRQTQYDLEQKFLNDLLRQRDTAQVIVKGKEIDFVQSRQGLSKSYVRRFLNWDKVGTPGWSIFLQRIQNHSGKHVHQGGLAIYVLGGEGYTVVDGQKYDWEEGDLIMLPVSPGGVEHQHFNKDPNRPAEWMAFIYETMRDIITVGRTQVEEHPDWTKPK